MLRDEFFHFILSAAVGTVVGYFTGHWWAVPIALISGFFIDADHLIDYFIFEKFQRFDSKQFFKGENFDRSGKVYVFAHGFEFAIILIVLGFIFPNSAWIYFSLGFSNLLHLLFDTFRNGAIWPTYFISFRIAKNFDHKKLWLKK